MTGNIDTYLIEDKSYDVGYSTKDSAIVDNFTTFYNHLWDEAAEKCDADNPINLHLDIIVWSYEFISYKSPLSIRKLEKIVKESQSIKLFLHESGSMLQIKGINNKTLSIYFERRNDQSFEYSGDILHLEGIINDKPHMEIKEATSFSVKTLYLRALWAS